MFIARPHTKFLTVPPNPIRVPDHFHQCIHESLEAFSAAVVHLNRPDFPSYRSLRRASAPAPRGFLTQ